MFKDLEKPWQIALNAMWQSHLNGSFCVGAVAVDTNGEIIAVGQNKGNEGIYDNYTMAHAEMDALWQIKYFDHPNIREYTFYSTLEPCPMCMGSITMSNFRNLRVILQDPFAGSTYLCRYDDYIGSKQINVKFETGTLMQTTAIVLGYREYTVHGNNLPISSDAVRKHYSKEFAIGKKLVDDPKMADFVISKAGFEDVYNYIEEEILA